MRPPIPDRRGNGSVTPDSPCPGRQRASSDCDASPTASPAYPLPRAASMFGSAASLTSLQLTWIAGRCEHSLRFGRVVHEQPVSQHSRMVAFRPGTVFALVRRISSDFGMTFASMSVVRAAGHGEACTPLPCVQPGGDILLHIETWPRVVRVLAIVDAMEADGIDPCDASHDHWRDVAARLNDGRQLRPYTRARHAAWLQRRRSGR